MYQTYITDYLFIESIDVPYIKRLIDKASTIARMDTIDVRYFSRINKTFNRTRLISVKTCSEEDLEKLDDFLNWKCCKSRITYVRGV